MECLHDGEYRYLYKFLGADTGKQPTFLEWMQERHHTSPTVMKVICRQTCPYRNWRKEYEAAMEWLRRRYRYEMELLQQLITNNPFEEENNNGNEFSGINN